MNISSSPPPTSFNAGILSLYPRTVSISNSSVTGRSIGVYYAVSGNSAVETAEYALRNTTLTGNSIGLLLAAMSTNEEPITTINTVMENNTIVSNSGNGSDPFSSATQSSGAIFATGTQGRINASLKNNIIAHNLYQGNVKNCSFGNFQYSPNVTTSATNNLSDDSCAGRFGDNDFTDVPDVADKIDVLSDNGGGVKTMALLLGSTAIDQGTTIGGITSDARGIPRPQNGIFDIGAFEKTVTTDPIDPEPEDPDNPGPPGGVTAGGSNTGVIPSAPRTGKLVGAVLLSVSLIALLVLVSKEIVDGRIKLSKSDK